MFPIILNAPPAPDAPPAVNCVPSNELLSGAVNPVLGNFVGAIGGIFPQLAIGVFILMAIVAIVMVRSDKAQKFMQAAAIPLVILVGVPLAILIVLSFWGWINGMCSTSLF